MPDPTWIHSANLGLRAALAALLLLLAAVLLRDHGRALAARLGAWCAAGAAAYALCSVPSAAPAAGVAFWQLPLAALTTGNAVVFWLLSRALFDDGFVLRRWHLLAWFALAGAGVVHCSWLLPGRPVGDALGALILLATLAASVLAVGQSLATWRDDLVEGRRRLRIFIVGGGAVYTLLNTGTRLVLHPSPTAELASLIDAVGLALLVAPIVWQLMGGSRAELFVAAPAIPQPAVLGASVGVGVGDVAVGTPQGMPRAVQALEPLAPLAPLQPLLPSATLGPPPATPNAPSIPVDSGAAAANDAVEAAEPTNPAEAGLVPDSVEAGPLADADLRLIEALADSMESERLYREGGLTIGSLAQRLGTPEHRLRRLINQHLGHRNFNQYLNGYRLAEAKAALADPAQAEQPVLAIAMEAGFQSLGPFNRAFKADTGLTPSEYRRIKSDEPQPLPPRQSSGQWKEANA